MSNAWLYNHITNIQKILKNSAVASIFFDNDSPHNILNIRDLLLRIIYRSRV